MPNRLIDETSPYLLQHAHNPVDWYPWGLDSIYMNAVVPLLRGRDAIEGKATAYMCQNFACQMPVTTADALEAQLNR
jgi:uncharacterized protein YyaL (SSP411 family)